MNFRTIGLGLFALVAIGTAASGVAQTTVAPPAPPLPNTNRTASPILTPGPASSSTLAPNVIASTIPAANVPTASPTPGAPTRGRKPAGSASASPAASATPEPPQFSALDGVWEIELQPLNQKRAVYSHMSIVQGTVTGNSTVLSGYWQRNNAKLPMTGTFDGRLISMTVTDQAGPITFSGYVESFGDMVGVQKIGTTSTSFTAQHRKKEKL